MSTTRPARVLAAAAAVTLAVGGFVVTVAAPANAVLVVTALFISPNGGAPPPTLAEVGTSVCVTARTILQNGDDANNITVNFEVTGANPQTGTGVTSGTGRANFCYVPANEGNDGIKATLGDLEATANYVQVGPNDGNPSNDPSPLPTGTAQIPSGSVGGLGIAALAGLAGLGAYAWTRRRRSGHAHD